MLLTAAGQDRPIGNDRELENAVVAMREALERAQLEAQERLQAAVAQASAEADQLRAAITTMREELEAQHARHLEAMQEQRQLAADEIRQLQATIQALREELEAKSR